MTVKPSTWIFVECQKNESDCAFGWLKNYGIIHKFVKMDEDSECLFLKQPLWNIGASSCSESRLCFVDSDVVLCESNWLEKADAEFRKGKDVLSLAAFQYYQHDEKRHLIETIGRKWVHRRQASAHGGFTIGMTRSAFEEMGGFDASLILDDIHTYYKLFGRMFRKWFEKWLCQIQLPKDRITGYNLNLGYVDTVACHIWHGDHKSKYDELTKFIRHTGMKSIYEIVEWDDRNISIPKWKSDSRSLAMRNTLKKWYSSDEKVNLIEEYDRQMETICGTPDKLYVFTVVKDGFGVDIDRFKKFRDDVEMKYNRFHPIVCFFTDANLDFSANDINAIPLKDYDPDNEFTQCQRDDLNANPGSIGLYIPVDNDISKLSPSIWIQNGIVKNQDGTTQFMFK